MAIAFVKNGGVNSNKAGATSLAVTVPAGGHAIGNLVLVTHDNDIQTAPTISDTGGNTWTQLHLQSPGSTNRVVVWGSVLTTALAAGDTITVSGGATAFTRAAMVSAEFSGAAITESVASIGANGTSATPSVGPSASIPSGSLVLGVLGINGPTGETYTEDTDTVGGAWVSGPRTGTSGGSAASNQVVGIAYKIANATATQTYNPAITSRAWVAVLVALDAAVVGNTFTKTGIGITDNTVLGADVVAFSETGAGISPYTVLGAKGISVGRTGSGISALTALGADVATRSETGTGISPFAVLGSRVREFAGKTGLGISPFVASGPKIVERTYIKTGLGISNNFIASGADVFAAAETGAGISPRTASAADVFAAGETGSGISAFTVLGANANVFSESGTGVSPFAVLGTRARDLPRTGAGISPRTGSGADAIIFTETGAGIMVMTASGTKVIAGAPIIYTKTGLAIMPLTVSAADLAIFTETGSGISARNSSGADTFILSRLGTGISPFSGSGSKQTSKIAIKTGLSISPFASFGADAFIVTETGSGIIVMTSSGTSADAFEVPCLYLPLTAEIDPHITSIAQNLISYVVTVDDPLYRVTVIDSYILVATINDDINIADIEDDIRTLTEIEMKSC